jgi:hypothetical protein
MASDMRTLAQQAVAQRLAKRQMEPTETGDRSPDELGTVTGWRAWNVNRAPDEDGKLLLESVTYGYAWVPFEKARASCERCQSTDPRKPDCTPGDHCSCGFYAAKSLNHLRKMGYHSYSPEGVQVTIVGRLAMWGKVVEGSQGWRAEYAYPEMLYVPFEVARLIARPASDTYGVPVTLLNVLDPEAKAGRPGSKRQLARVLPPRTKEPKFLEEYRTAHRVPGYEELDEE